MMRLFAIALVTLAALPAAADGLAVTRLEATASGQALRIDLGLTRDPVFSLFTLSDPYRLVIDMPAFAWAASPPDVAAIPGVADVRYGLFRHDTGRIVIELDAPMAVRSAHVALAHGGPDLVLDLAQTTPQAFALTAGWPDDARWRRERLSRSIDPEAIVVAIDPGHGGFDPGAVHGRLYEKDVVLDMGHRLAALIDALPGMRAVLTREDDRFVPLRTRLRIAREARAHLFVSLHADSVATGEVDGASVYTLSRRDLADRNRRMAEHEHRAEILSGINLSGAEDDVTRLLIDLARRGTTAESVKLAETILDALEGEIALLSTRPHRRDDFVVLRAPDLPAVLVELGFLTSGIDRERLTDEAWLDRMAARLAEGIRRWVGTASPGFLSRRG